MTASADVLVPADRGETLEELVHIAEEHAKGGISNPVLGMILFIASEVMFFAGLFAAYFSLRANAPVWPPAGNAEFDLRAHIALPAVLTLMLILSSVTCQIGIWAIRRGDRKGLMRAFTITIVLGILFLAGQLYDYSQLGFGVNDGVFGSTFYTLTGFHGAHVFAGVLMLGVILYRGMAGQFSGRHHDAVEATSLYWHFVDVVWICLFTLLYILN
ncbi:MAG: cytochrome c oxidase subunit 3 [Chloroflexi bacterium]|nr:cytochrome c oxidase subunit 3 [Chloroflexota bacterium]